MRETVITSFVTPSRATASRPVANRGSEHDVHKDYEQIQTQRYFGSRNAAITAFSHHRNIRKPASRP